MEGVPVDPPVPVKTVQATTVISPVKAEPFLTKIAQDRNTLSPLLQSSGVDFSQHEEGFERLKAEPEPSKRRLQSSNHVKEVAVKDEIAERQGRMAIAYSCFQSSKAKAPTLGAAHLKGEKLQAEGQMPGGLEMEVVRVGPSPGLTPPVLQNTRSEASSDVIPYVLHAQSQASCIQNGSCPTMQVQPSGGQTQTSEGPASEETGHASESLESMSPLKERIQSVLQRKESLKIGQPAVVTTQSPQVTAQRDLKTAEEGCSSTITVPFVPPLKLHGVAQVSDLKRDTSACDPRTTKAPVFAAAMPLPASIAEVGQEPGAELPIELKKARTTSADVQKSRTAALLLSPAEQASQRLDTHLEQQVVYGCDGSSDFSKGGFKSTFLISESTKPEEEKGTVAVASELMPTCIRNSPQSMKSSVPIADLSDSLPGDTAGVFTVSSKAGTSSMITKPEGPSSLFLSPILPSPSVTAPTLRASVSVIPKVSPMESPTVSRELTAPSNQASDAEVGRSGSSLFGTSLPISRSTGPNLLSDASSDPSKILNGQLTKEECIQLSVAEESDLVREGQRIPNANRNAQTKPPSLQTSFQSDVTTAITAKSTLVEPVKALSVPTGRSLVHEPSQTPNSQLLGMCSVEARRPGLMTRDCSGPDVQHRPGRKMQPCLEVVKQEAASHQNGQESSNTVIRAPKIGFVVTSKKLQSSHLQMTRFGTPTLHSQRDSESSVVQEESNTLQNCLSSSALRAIVHPIGLSSTAPATIASLNKSASPTKFAPPELKGNETKALPGELTGRLPHRTNLQTTGGSFPPNRGPLKISQPSLIPTIEKDTTSTASVDPTVQVPVQPSLRVSTPYISIPHISTPLVRALRVSSVNLSTPQVATPIQPRIACVSTPCISAPFVPSTSLSTPVVPSPALTSSFVFAPSVPPALPQAHATPIAPRLEARITPGSSQVMRSVFPPSFLAATRVFPNGSNGYAPGSSQPASSSVTASRYRALKSSQWQRTPAPQIQREEVAFEPRESLPSLLSEGQQPENRLDSLSSQPTGYSASAAREQTGLSGMQDNLSSSQRPQRPAPSLLPIREPFETISNRPLLSPSQQLMPSSSGQEGRNMSSCLTDFIGNSQSQSSSRKCVRCGVSNTRAWRTGPDGVQTLCNSCGLRYEHHNMIIYEDITSGRLSAVNFPGSRPVQVTGFHTRGFCSDLSVKLSEGMGAYRRPPRALSRPIIAPFNFPPVSPNDTNVHCSDGHARNVSIRSAREPAVAQPTAAQNEVNRESGLPPTTPSYSSLIYNSSEQLEGELPPEICNESHEGRDSVENSVPRVADRPVEEAAELLNEQQGLSEPPAKTPFSRFVRKRRSIASGAEDSDSSAEEEGRAADAEEPDSIDILSLESHSVHDDVVHIDVVDVDASFEEAIDQGAGTNGDGSTLDNQACGLEHVRNVDNADVVCLLSESEDAAPNVSAEKCMAGSGKQLTYRRPNTSSSVDVVDLTSEDQKDIDSNNLTPQANVQLVDDIKTDNITRHRPGRTTLLSPSTTHRLVTDRQISCRDTERTIFAVGRRPGRTERLPYPHSNRSLERGGVFASARTGTRNHATDVEGGFLTSELHIRTNENQRSPCSGTHNNSHQKAGKKRPRTGLEPKMKSVRQKLQTWEESFSEVEDSSGDRSKFQQPLLVREHRRGLATMLNLSPDGSEKPVADTDRQHPRLYSVKAEYKAGLHRLAIPHGLQFLEFKARMQEVFQVSQAIALQYKDNEGDFITITSDSDMEEMFIVVHEHSLSPIRIRLCDLAKS